MPLHSVLSQLDICTPMRALQVERRYFLTSYEIRFLKFLGLSNDARDRRGSGCEWRRLDLAFFDKTVALVPHSSKRYNLDSNQSYAAESRFLSWH